MGILTRRQGETFIISSDRDVGGQETKRPPRRMNDAYQVWAGETWSPNIDDAMIFGSLEEADEYVQMHYAKLSACNQSA